MRYLLIVLCSVIILGCARRLTTSGTSGSYGKYSEDLSVWRPETEDIVDSTKTAGIAPERPRFNLYVEPRYAVNDQVNAVLDSIYEQNFTKGYINGYTIQVYSGIKREEALGIKKKLSQSLPEIESDLEYRQPNFRVRTGRYLSRLDAQEDYLAVKEYFPNAIVIPDRLKLQ